ncbi:MAG: hypothetical protein GYA30_06470 [Chloroflexi bacterium]|nr:hypothetical protein [Chloroflexota bacterium]OQA95711.1 MAG: hypothetical protein BWY25_02368 [Chloroflexi bacterium ADurb.Bin222]HOC22594.1 hypothetical protein [Anaerolineae bacterium]HQE98801.1 hypothetical protein [Anaerolineae bacterium]HQM15501.1 hypothetical protein [Anaerolineae bacterium]
MPRTDSPDLGLFLDILQTLEALDIPYMIIGAFAGTVYGVTRVTYDIDIVVDLDNAHIDALADAYPAPRYYADPYQMRSSVAMGIMFNIIDSERGEKADLIPLTMASPYRTAFQNRVRQTVETPDGEPFDVWCARPEDVIVGKLMAWAEGRSRKHESDIHEMLVYDALGFLAPLGLTLDEAYVERRAAQLGADVLEFWRMLKAAARKAQG